MDCIIQPVSIKVNSWESRALTWFSQFCCTIIWQSWSFLDRSSCFVFAGPWWLYSRDQRPALGASSWAKLALDLPSLFTRDLAVCFERFSLSDWCQDKLVRWRLVFDRRKVLLFCLDPSHRGMANCRIGSVRVFRLRLCGALISLSKVEPACECAIGIFRRACETVSKTGQPK